MCPLHWQKEGKSVTVVDQLKREDFIMEMPIFNKADLLDQLENLNSTYWRTADSGGKGRG